MYIAHTHLNFIYALNTKETTRLNLPYIQVTHRNRVILTPDIEESTWLNAPFGRSDSLKGRMSSQHYSNIFDYSNKMEKRVASPPPQNDDESDEELNSETEALVFNTLMLLAKQQNQEEWDKKANRYMDEGMEEEDATEKANMKMKEANITAFFKKYGQLITYILQLKNGLVHNDVMEVIEEKIDAGLSEKRAIKFALRKFRNDIEAIVYDSDSSDDEEEEETEDQEEDQEEEIVE